ncbi:MAG: DUF4160 domain-containing protein [Devosia sp.]|nr:DUF4160 domain-containing protein [Devosia sp.]
MVTVPRIAGLRFIVFANDHELAHVHVFGDGQTKINLLGPDGKPALVWVDGLKRSDVRRAMRSVIEHHSALLARWRDIHG